MKKLEDGRKWFAVVDPDSVCVWYPVHVKLKKVKLLIMNVELFFIII